MARIAQSLQQCALPLRKLGSQLAPLCALRHLTPLTQQARYLIKLSLTTISLIQAMKQGGAISSAGYSSEHESLFIGEGCTGWGMSPNNLADTGKLA